MIITLSALRSRVRRHGKDNYRYIGRCTDNRYPDGSGYTLAIIDDCYRQETIHVDADDETVAKICGAMKGQNAATKTTTTMAATNNQPIPADIWKMIEKNSMKYQLAAAIREGKTIDELITRFANTAVGTQIPGKAEDARKIVAALKEMQN